MATFIWSAMESRIEALDTLAKKNAQASLDVLLSTIEGGDSFMAYRGMGEDTDWYMVQFDTVMGSYFIRILDDRFKNEVEVYGRTMIELVDSVSYYDDHADQIISALEDKLGMMLC